MQSDLARDLQVSTTPVREALRDLATEGLIQLDAHRGATVQQLSFEEIQEIQHLCSLLEPRALAIAVRTITDEQLDRAEDLVAAMEQECDIGLWADLNRRFHATLVESLSGSRLHSMLKGLRDAAAPYVGLSLHAPDNQLHDANSDHRELLDAVRAGDAERAADVSRHHAELTMAVLERSRVLLDSAGSGVTHS